LALRLTVKKESTEATAVLEKIELAPVVIENYDTPRLAKPAEAARLTAKLGQIALTLPAHFCNGWGVGS